MYLEDKSIPEDLANRIFNILIEHAGASSRNRKDFVFHQGQKPHNNQGGCNEYRFQGKLGFGGKFWNCNNKFYVSAYIEDKGSPEEKIISKVNELLKPIYKEFLERKKK